MTEEKRNRLIAAVTVNVILLIAILAAVCIYQIVVMVIEAGHKREIEEKIEFYESETEMLEKSLEYYQSNEYKLDKAYEYGFVFGK